MQQHWVFIVNPRSGTQRVKRVEEAAARWLDAARISHEIRTTTRAGHGTDIAREAGRDGAFGVVAVGGDGSVADAAMGVLGTGTRLAILPKGSGNGLARSLRIPLSERGALSLINVGATVHMDVGYANDRPFLSNAGVGFDALIAQAFAQSVRRGFQAYAGLVTRHLWAYRAQEVILTLDDEPPRRERAFMLSVANGQQFGYGFRIAPNASWTDGLLDVVVLRAFPRIFGAGLVMRAMAGTLLQSPYVRCYRARRVVVSHPGLAALQTDGDAQSCAGEVVFRVEPGALQIVVP